LSERRLEILHCCDEGVHGIRDRGTVLGTGDLDLWETWRHTTVLTVLEVLPYEPCRVSVVKDPDPAGEVG
jgi:hypothetical protein